MQGQTKKLESVSQFGINLIGYVTANAGICGVSGQDGAFLAQLLLDKGYEVYGTRATQMVQAITRTEFLVQKMITVAKCQDELSKVF